MRLLRHNNKNGFTLIELLIAMSILVILMAVGLFIFTTVLKNSRDQQRIKDLLQIKQALEMYRSDKGYYPGHTAVSGPPNLVLDLADLNIPAGKIYLQSLPKDPLTAQHYGYVALTASNNLCPKPQQCTSYILCAKAENSGYLVSAYCTTQGAGYSDPTIAILSP